MSEDCSNKHPDPKTVKWLFCRSCGYWVNSVRESDATDAVLRSRLAQHVGAEVDLMAGGATLRGQLGSPSNKTR